MQPLYFVPTTWDQKGTVHIVNFADLGASCVGHAIVAFVAWVLVRR